VYEEEFWPYSSPDSNSFRYFVYGESEVCLIAKSRKKSEDLVQKIKDVMGSFNRDTVAKPATARGPGSRLLLVMTTVLINKMFLYNYLCTFVFTSIKSDDFQLCCVISK
jgi:hypothetical protein